MEKVSTNPDEHLQALPDAVRDDMVRLDKAISDVMQDESRTLWVGKFWGGSDQTIIGYGDYTYSRPGNKTVEWFKVGLALQKNYISLYVNAVEGGQYLAEKYAGTLGKVKVGKSSISFKKLADVNLDVLLDLIRKAKDTMA